MCCSTVGFLVMDELDDITFSQSMRIIIDALMDVVMEFLTSCVHQILSGCIF